MTPIVDCLIYLSGLQGRHPQGNCILMIKDLSYIGLLSAVLSFQGYSLVKPVIDQTKGPSHYNHLGESTFIFRGVRCVFYFLSHFSMKFLCANRIATDGTPSAASHLGLFCLPMSHKRDARLK